MLALVHPKPKAELQDIFFDRMAPARQTRNNLKGPIQVFTFLLHFVAALAAEETLGVISVKTKEYQRRKNLSHP